MKSDQPGRQRQSPMPLVSVVIPTRNRAHFLPASVRSALDQTIQDIEVLVIDNGSTDGTAEVISSLASNDSRVIALTCATPGPAPTRNLGLAHARGLWVAFLDDDDLWAPDALSSLLDSTSAETQSIAGRAVSFSSETGSVSADEILAAPASFAVRPWPACPFKSPVTLVDLLWRARIPTDAAVFRASVLRELGGFDESYQVAEDYELWLRLAWRREIVVRNRNVLLCRHHRVQLTARQAELSRQTRTVVERFLVAHPEVRLQLGRARTRRRLAMLHREEAYEALLNGKRRWAARSAARSLLLWPAELKSLVYLIFSPLPALYRVASQARPRLRVPRAPRERQ